MVLKAQELQEMIKLTDIFPQKMVEDERLTSSGLESLERAQWNVL